MPETMTMEQVIQKRFQARQEAEQPSQPSETPEQDQGQPQEASAVVAEPQQAEAEPELDLDQEGNAGEYGDQTGEIEEGAPDEDAEDPEDTADEDREVTFLHKGKEITVTESELQKGYMLERDYTHSKMALAEEKRAVSQQAEGVKAQSQQNLAILQAIAAEFTGNPVQPPNAALFSTNRPQYDAEMAAYTDWQHKATNWSQALQNFQAELDAQKAKEFEEQALTEVKNLSQALDIPLSDSQTLSARIGELQQFAVENYPIPSELVRGTVLPHGFYLMALDAKKHKDAHKSLKARKKGKGKRSMAPIKGGRTNVNPQPVSESSQARKRVEELAPGHARGDVRRNEMIDAVVAARKARRAEAQRRR